MDDPTRERQLRRRRSMRISEAADAAGVSIATVSRVLNGIGEQGVSVETDGAGASAPPRRSAIAR
jgi:transcriptional regulator with XRE-family HTH domain